MKKLIRYITFFIGISFILFSTLFLLRKVAVSGSLKHDKKIQIMFDNASSYINSLKKLPTYQEFKNWSSAENTPFYKYKFLQYDIHNENFPLNKNIPKDEYILSMWRGESFYYYYSWKKKKSTVPSGESRYSITGYILGDFLVFFLIGLFFFKISSILKRP